MNAYRRWLQAVFAAIPIILVVIVWVVFSPRQLGGQVSYVIIRGSSMEPAFHFGDLVIVRQSPEYRVGDVVAYFHAQMSSVVIHRILATDHDRFIFKGDHNTWTDSYQPTREELIGKLWLQLPGFGKFVQKIRTPLFMALFAGAAGVLLMTTPVKKSSHKRKRPEPNPVRKWLSGVWNWLSTSLVKKPDPGGQPKISRTKSTAITLRRNPSDLAEPPVQSRPPRNLTDILEALFFVLGFVAIACLVLGVYTFTQPLIHTVPDDIKYQQSGVFSYTARAPSGVYDSTSVTSGQPVFSKLTCLVELTFKYVLTGEQLQGLTGSHQLTALVTEQTSNWTRSLPLEQQTAFTGNTYTTVVVLDLCQVETLVANMEQATDSQSGLYALIITPRVTIAGNVAAHGLQDTFNPRLVFQFDKLRAYLIHEDPKVDPLNPSQTGLIKATRSEANSLSAFGFRAAIQKMRVFSIYGFSLSLAGLLAVGLFISLSTRHNQQAYARMKYGSMLVDVQGPPLDATTPVADVVTLDDLARLAERYNTLILHETSGFFHFYYVQGDRITYRYALDEVGTGLPQGVSFKESGMRDGIERGEFRVYYQPIVSLTDSKITTVEALLRWQHPERGLVSAADFIQMAENTGLIDKIGEWMLKVACTQLKSWQDDGLNVRLAVNISQHQLQKDPVDFIAQVLRTTGVEPQALQIEVPEASLAAGKPEVLSTLQKLGELGIQISVDNFAGRSPLSSLDLLPVNSIKIDRTYVAKLDQPDSAIAVSELIGEAKSRGLNVIAEGVETENQLGFLRVQLCTLAQGYLLGRPAPAEEVTRLLQENQQPAAGPGSQGGTPGEATE
jgi:signal peptidase I